MTKPHERTRYYSVSSWGDVGKKFDDQAELQVHIATNGAPHHTVSIMAITFDKADIPIKTRFLPVWYTHWRLLTLAKVRAGDDK